MSEKTPEKSPPPAEGRPSPGAIYAAEQAQAGARRARSKDLSSLAALWPYVVRHRGLLIGALIFLALASAATLAWSR